MKKNQAKFCIFVLGIVMMLLPSLPAFAENKIKTGMDLPDLMLEGSDCMEKTDYLDVKNDERYMNLSKIPSKIKVIEFFNVYCPVCKKQAPVANKLYSIIQRNPDLKNDVKMLVVAIGNRQTEIDAYKQQNYIKFPVFIDPYSKLHKQHGIGEVPYTMVVDKDLKVLHTHLGIIENLDEFLGKIEEFQKKQ